jgi:two-component system alkaline phosphatase synthesis response regulator PhoP
MKQKLIELIEQSNKDSFTKEELLKIFSSFGNNEEDGYTIVEDQYAIEYENVKQILPRKQFKLLVYLMRNKGRVVSREEMLRNVWEEGVVVGDRTIDVHICKIKRRFPDIPIKLRKCYGYLWSN